ncbi:Mur ligase family protein, partial [Saccharopolyspora sp. WRP15-2]
MAETTRETGAVEPTSGRRSPAGQQWRVVPAPVQPPQRGGHRLDLRTTIAIDLGRLASSMSRRLGLGSGAMIGGRLALSLQPQALRRLVVGRRVVMVTGTNGKTTTTRMVAEALRSRAPAVSNATGANMLDGHVAALMTRPSAPFAALEVDELHLAQVTAQFEPAVILLLNLSRDQLDRVGEIRTVAESLRRALTAAPGAHVIANRDDPNIVFAAADHPSVTWISGGARWKGDALNCPRCGAFLGDADQDWRCACGLSRPAADWTVA